MKTPLHKRRHPELDVASGNTAPRLPRGSLAEINRRLTTWLRKRELNEPLKRK